MNHWTQYLVDQGGSVAGGAIGDFGNPSRERQAVGRDTVLVPLLQWSLWQATGTDAHTFLQGQLSNDIQLVTSSRAQLSAYCNPKGRMLAVFQIFERSSSLFVMTRREIAESTFKRLKMYVMRANVAFTNGDTEFAAIGLAGPSAASSLGSIFPREIPANTLATNSFNNTTVIRKPGPIDRFEIIAPIETMKQHWHSLSKITTPVGSDAWDWFDIMSGLPIVVGTTVEEFVPQMANLDILEGINFKKGCYPGQEIVARMHYLGSLKQRMVRASISPAPDSPAGTPVYSATFGDQVAGRVVLSHQSPDSDRCDLLIVVQLTAWRANDLRIGAPDGPEVRFESLPYVVPVPDIS